MTTTAADRVAAPAIDGRTFALFLVHAIVVVLNFVAAAQGWIAMTVAFVVGLAAFNLSFTIWHECVHNTVARNRHISGLIGRITALLLVYPGYSTLKRDHLLHHKYQGSPDLDPVYPRVQCSPWMFPVHLVRTLAFGRQPDPPEGPLPASERLKDVAGYVMWAAGAVIAALAGWGPALLVAWVIPRLVILPIHSFYVCYLPHAPDGPRVYQTYRVVLRTPLTRYLTLYHSFHGLHHLWPSVPWHRYRAVFVSRRQLLERHGVEIVE